MQVTYEHKRLRLLCGARNPP